MLSSKYLVLSSSALKVVSGANQLLVDRVNERERVNERGRVNERKRVTEREG
jgi:hypothetical protein